ncbi:MAG: HD domain-containing protein [Deltaproteobacteria bacterium]|nr:HD domain-containing protein [Deltaproteobacteria bacterium]
MGTWSRMTESDFQKVWKSADEARQRYEDHDTSTAQHSVRVAHWAVLLASRLPNFPQARLRRLEITALLHDYGKTFLDPAVIRKTGPLDEAEWVEMKRHPELGLQNLPVPETVVEPDGILWHHKRFDGSGYPEGDIAGIRLALEARIISVADVFDALTSQRPYRTTKPAYEPPEALGIMREIAGKQLDPSLVPLFDAVYRLECERVGGQAGARTLQVRSAIGMELERAQDLLRTIIGGPIDVDDPLQGIPADNPVLGRLVAGLLRSTLDLRSAENVARTVLKMPLSDTFRAEDILDSDYKSKSVAVQRGVTEFPKHHREVVLRLKRMPPNVAYMRIVVYQGDLWICVGEREGDVIEVQLAR